MENEKKIKTIFMILREYLQEVDPPTSPLTPFDILWKDLKISWVKKNAECIKNKKEPLITDYSTCVQDDIERCIKFFKIEKTHARINEKIKKGELDQNFWDNPEYAIPLFNAELAKTKEPTLDEFKKYFIDFLGNKNRYPLNIEHVCVRVSWLGQIKGRGLSKKIKNEFQGVLRKTVKNLESDSELSIKSEWIKSPYFFCFDKNGKKVHMIDIEVDWDKFYDWDEKKGLLIHVQYNKPRLMLEEIERYLKVYRMYERYKGKYKVADIISKVYANKNCEEANVQRSFFQDIQRAKNIMKNIKKGIFPGDYQPSNTEN